MSRSLLDLLPDQYEILHRKNFPVFDSTLNMVTLFGSVCLGNDPRSVVVIFFFPREVHYAVFGDSVSRL